MVYNPLNKGYWRIWFDAKILLEQKIFEIEYDGAELKK